MEFGTIDWFNGTKGYGVAKIDVSEEEVFLHLNHFSDIKEGQNKPQFVGNCARRPNLQKGDKVTFVTEEGPRGLRARQWGLRLAYDATLAKIQTRPMYRIIRAIHEPDVEVSAEDCNVLWVGKDLWAAGLQNHYNPKHDRYHYGHDEFTSRKWWQVSYNNGETWRNCDCPQEYADQFDSFGRRQRR
jgi:cold shock CspA family protein